MHWLPTTRRLAERTGRSAALYAGRAFLTVSIAFGALGAQSLGHAHAAGPQPFNLSIDENKDGVPDELAQAVNTVAVAQTKEDQEAAIKDLVSRLPYSDETRALQDEAGKLQQQIETVKDPAEAEQLTQQIAELGEAMKKDPAYDQSIAALDTLLKPQELQNEKLLAQPIPWGAARAGDILLEYNLSSLPTYLYAMNYGHTGNCYNYQCGLVFESIAEGVRVRSRSYWTDTQYGLKYVTIARSRASSSSVVAQMEARKQQWVDQRNTPYNFFWPNKWTEDAVYCAQLTWKIHLGTGRDLDSNDWRYYLYIWSRWGGLVATLVVIPAVAPDEIGFSNNIYVVGSGRNF